MITLKDKLKKLIDPEYISEIDFENCIDNTLTFNENIELLREKYNYAFKSGSRKRIIPKSPEYDDLPQELNMDHLKRFAYFGGRIELFKRGRLKNIHHYDINSAYPHAITKIPNLRGGKFSFLSDTTEDDLGDNLFGVVQAESLDKNPIMAPLPFRLKNGYVVYPQGAKGYYHICEVIAAINKGYNIKLGGSWILETPYTYPYTDFIEDLMKQRLQYKRVGDFAHIPLKLGVNSFYGKLAQKPSMYKNKLREPKYRDLLMAGFITAHTRGRLLTYASQQDTILMATDGIYSEIPLKCNIGDKLGEWEYNKHEQGIFILAGIYSVKDGDVWTPKIRGFRDLNIQELYTYIQKYPYDPIPLKDRRFVGIKYCLGLKEASTKYPLCNFVDIPRVIDWNNNRKRVFAPNGESRATHDLNHQRLSAMYKDKTTGGLNNVVFEDNALSECG